MGVEYSICTSKRNSGFFMGTSTRSTFNYRPSELKQGSDEYYLLAAPFVSATTREKEMLVLYGHDITTYPFYIYIWNPIAHRG